MNLNEISKYLDEKYPKNEGFFVFGSHVYGTNSKDSDIDLVVIYDEKHGQTESGKYDIQFVSKQSFLDQLLKCDIKSLEGYFTDKNFFKFQINVNIDWTQLRPSISQKASHSWVKSKKKVLDKEFYIGKKSLFHSLRILDFGIQLATFKEIKDFSRVNDLWEDIRKESNENLDKKYKSKYNELHSLFKKLTNS